MQQPIDLLAGDLGDGRFNIMGNSRDERARLLSNFANTPFFFEDEHFASLEGFIQGIKYQHGTHGRWRAFMSVGKRAKLMNPGGQQPLVWWKGVQIPYGSPEHRKLIECALQKKFMQNDDCREALLATGNLTLIHETGTPESAHASLPAKTFCNMLTELRVRLRKH